jgi:uncharacterized protein YcbK (DUF882 family)
VRLSRSFALAEFHCHSGEEVPSLYLPNLERLAGKVLQPMRDVWGPLIIISGWRSPAWNTRIGGAAASTHLTAEGADIRCVRPRDLGELVDLIEKRIAAGALPELGGVGLYPGWVHLDIRKAADGHLRRWGGRGMGSEPG